MRTHPGEQPVELVVLEDGGFIEPLDKGAAVVTGGHNAVVFELDQCLLNGDPADSQAHRDFIAIDAIPAAQLAGQQQVEDVRNNQVLFFDPVFFRHRFAESLSHPVRPSGAESFS